MSNRQSIDKKSPSKERLSKLSRKSEKDKVVDLDAQEEDKFGLNAQKNVTTNKSRFHNKNNQKKVKEAKKKSLQSDDEKIKEESSEEEYEDIGK